MPNVSRMRGSLSPNVSRTKIACSVYRRLTQRSPVSARGDEFYRSVFREQAHHYVHAFGADGDVHGTPTAGIASGRPLCQFARSPFWRTWKAPNNADVERIIAKESALVEVIDTSPTRNCPQADGVTTCSG
jgi:hypothetical protein